MHKITEYKQRLVEKLASYERHYRGLGSVDWERGIATKKSVIKG